MLNNSAHSRQWGATVFSEKSMSEWFRYLSLPLTRTIKTQGKMDRNIFCNAFATNGLTLGSVRPNRGRKRILSHAFYFHNRPIHFPQ